MDLQPENALPLIDCRGLQCPAPILRLSEVARKHKDSGSTLTVVATDVDFPVDLEAWCRTTKSSLVRLEHEQGGVIRAHVKLAGKPAAPATSVVASATTISGTASRSDRGSNRSAIKMHIIDLIGMPSVDAMRKLNEASVTYPGCKVTVQCDAPGFESKLAAWAGATDATIESMLRHGKSMEVVLSFSGEAESESSASAPPVITIAPPKPIVPVTGHPSLIERRRESSETAFAKEATSPAPVAIQPFSRAGELTDRGASPRENRVTLLVLHNDLEALLAALMVANASAAQGMNVEVYFAFWGIHLLRGEKPRKAGDTNKTGLLQKMMLWMVPKGPSRQKLGKLHMGGIGTRILLMLMRKRNILALDKLVEAAATQGVKFRVCSMSMGLMGISQRDVIDLPNVDFAGVTSFAETASRSSVSLVF